MAKRLLGCCYPVLLMAAALAVSPAWAIDTVSFSTSDAGVSKSIDWWGMDTAWPSPDNMRQGVFHMGADQIDVVRVNFYIDEPLQANGTLGPNTISRLNTQLEIAEMAGDKPIAMTPNSGDATDPWYLNGNEVNVARWIDVIQATRQYIADQGKTVIEVEPFNEPDFWPGQGTPANLNSVMTALNADPDFQNVAMVGPSTLNSDNFSSWYNAVSGPADYGATHQLAGSTDSYVNFIQQVAAAGDTPYNPEIHSMAEVLYGAEYGLEGAIWWGPAFLTRGLVVNAVQGDRLGYAENRGTGTAAAVYRSPDGSVRAYAGGFERDYQGTPTSYKIVSTDQDLYFNGIGPIREYTVHATQTDQGSFVDIQSEADAPPALDGSRWQIVNRSTGEVLQVQGGGLGDGADIRTGAEAGELHQRWNLVRELDGYFRFVADHSGKTAEIANWSLENGGNAQQWGTGESILQRWFVEPAPDGYFYVRNGHSNKYLTAGSGGTVYQQDATRNRPAQQWEFVLANPGPDDVIAAHLKFEGNGLDSVGSSNATLTGSPAFVAGADGQAMRFDGINDYATLPAGVANSEDLTVAAWVKWDGGPAWQRIFDFGDSTTANMFLTPASGDGTMRFAITTDGNMAEQILETDALPVGEWVHLAVTLGGNTGVLYVNGAPQTAGQIVLDPSDFNPDLNYVGKSQYPDALFDGLIDDFRIYHDALDAAQIANLVRPGDYNGDGVVDAADYSVWRDGLGVTYSQADYDVWVENFGANYNSGLATSVPEPAAVLLVALGVAFGVRQR